MKQKNDKYSDEKILEIIVLAFILSMVIFLFVKIMFF